MKQLSLFDQVFNRFVLGIDEETEDQLESEQEAENDSFLKGLWLDLRTTWFPKRTDIDLYVVTWSQRRQKRTLASCNIDAKRVIVARELQHEKYLEWIEPLLYHEMCHAYLGESVVREGQRTAWHGKDFRALEKRHPKMSAFDHWVESGGFESAVRSDRARRAHRARRLATLEDEAA